MRLLLDTQAFLWSGSAPERLSPRARRAIEAGRNEVFLSAASVWEIAIKTQIGRLRLARDVETFTRERMAESSLVALPVLLPHAIKVASLPEVHRDPFDRLLVAQAIVEDLHLVTADRRLRDYPVKVVW